MKPEDSLPTSFGKYFLTEQLATGGMAEIYLAKLVGPGGFEKQLVIKQIHSRLTGQRQFVDLLVAEAKTLVSLAHGNIVPVYELGVVDDRYFIAMEYVDGPTLWRLTERLAKAGERMPPPVAAWIVARILEGLDYAHRKGDGVLHRDLSPRNVMLSRDGEVKIVDFGIAVGFGTTDGGEDQAAPTGSFPYMSPEQVRREALEGQSDLFGVGVLFWEMLVGERLFARSDPDATLAAVTGGDIAVPSSVRPDVPAKLDEIVLRALERDRTARWRSAGDFLAAVQKYLYGLEATPGPRDLAALVAKYCPPEKRRLPTHADEATPTNETGPATAVIPRPPRPQTEKSFATHVAFDKLMERATPLFPVPAIVDEPPAPSPPPPVTQQPLGIGIGTIIAGAIGTLALGAGAIYVFQKGKAAVLDVDDAGVRTRPADAAPLVAPLDAAAVAIDAATPIDAPPPPIDAGGRKADAGAATAPPIDARITPTGDGTIKIGADPWGEITVDGIPKGRTPAELVLPSGKHTIDVTFRGVDPPAKKSFAIDLDPGEVETVHADFQGSP